MEIWFPGLTIPEVKIRKGLFLWIWLLGFEIVVPPWDIVLWGETVIWKGFRLLDLAWITDPILSALNLYFPDQMKWLRDIHTALIKTAENVAKILEELGKNPVGAIGKLVDYLRAAILKTIWGWVDGALRWATDTFRWLRREIGSDIFNLSTHIEKMVVGPIHDMWNDLLERIPNAVWGLFESTLDEMARDYYERHQKE